MASAQFSLQKEDWSLHRKGHQDQERHREKVKEAIKENLPDLVSEESIIMSDGKQILKIPIRSLEEYRFRYNFNKSRQAGSGDGDSQVGDVIAKGPPEQGQPGAGQGAGDAPGSDYIEADVALEDIEEVLFAELQLPNLRPKAPEQVVAEDIDFRDVRKKGLMGNIDKKRTLIEAIRRNQREAAARSTPAAGEAPTGAAPAADALRTACVPGTGRPAGDEQGAAARHAAGARTRILPDDLRFKTWDEVVKPDSNAVVLAIMDTSGSPDVA